MADIFVPLKPRSDLALINGLCYIILEQGWENETFIQERTNGYLEFKKHILAHYPPQEVAQNSPVLRLRSFTTWQKSTPLPAR